MSGGGLLESIDEDECEGDGDLNGEACASQPFAPSPSDAPNRGIDCDWCRVMPGSSSSRRRYGSSSSSSPPYTCASSRITVVLLAALAFRCGSSRSSRSGSLALPAREPSSVEKEKKRGWDEDRLDVAACCLFKNWDAYAANEVAMVGRPARSAQQIKLLEVRTARVTLCSPQAVAVRVLPLPMAMGGLPLTRLSPQPLTPDLKLWLVCYCLDASQGRFSVCFSSATLSNGCLEAPASTSSPQATEPIYGQL